MMLRKVLFGIVLCVFCGVVAFAAEGESTPAPEQTPAPESKSGWGLRFGRLTGDYVSDVPLGKPDDYLDEAPTLADSSFGGAFYYIDFKPSWRFEVRLNYAPSEVEHVCPNVDTQSDDPAMRSCRANEATVGTDILYFDLLVMPHFKIGKSRFGLGVPFGVGWANASADVDYAPPSELISRSGDVAMSGASGMTYFAGLRPFVTFWRGKTLFLEARLNRFHRLVNTNASTVHSNEYSVGMSFPLRAGKPKEPQPETKE
jgi:opacity protein-like surface antigen